MQLLTVLAFYIVMTVDLTSGVPLFYERTNVVNKVEFSDLGIDGDRIDPLIDVSEEDQRIRNISVTSHTEINVDEKPDSEESTHTKGQTQTVLKATVMPSNAVPDEDATVESNIITTLTSNSEASPIAEQTSSTRETVYSSGSPKTDSAITTTSDNSFLTNESSTVQPETTGVVLTSEVMPKMSTKNDAAGEEAENVYGEKSISTNLIDSTEIYVTTTILPAVEQTIISDFTTTVPTVTNTAYDDANDFKESSITDVETLSTTLMTSSEHASSETSFYSSTSGRTESEITTPHDDLTSTETTDIDTNTSTQTTEPMIEATSSQESSDSSNFTNEHPAPTSVANVPEAYTDSVTMTTDDSSETTIEESKNESTELLLDATTAASSESLTVTEQITTDTNLQTVTFVSSMEANEMTNTVTEVPEPMEVSTMENIIPDSSTVLYSSSSEIADRESTIDILPLTVALTEDFSSVETATEERLSVTETTTSNPITFSSEEIELITQTLIDNYSTAIPTSTETNFPTASNSEAINTGNTEWVTEVVNVTEEIISTEPSGTGSTEASNVMIAGEPLDTTTLSTLDLLTNEITTISQPTDPATKIETEAYDTTTMKDVSQDNVQLESATKLGILSSIYEDVSSITSITTEVDGGEKFTTDAMEPFTATENNGIEFVTLVVEDSLEMSTHAVTQEILTVTEQPSAPQTTVNVVSEKNNKATTTFPFSTIENESTPYSQGVAISTASTELLSSEEVPAAEIVADNVTAKATTTEVSELLAETTITIYADQTDDDTSTTSTTFSTEVPPMEQTDADETNTSSTFSGEETSSVTMTPEKSEVNSDEAEISTSTILASYEITSKDPTETTTSATDSSLAFTILALVTAPPTLSTTHSTLVEPEETKDSSKTSEMSAPASTARTLIPEESVVHTVTEVNLPNILDDDSGSSISSIPSGLNQESPLVALTTPTMDSGSSKHRIHTWHTLISSSLVTLLLFIL